MYLCMHACMYVCMYVRMYTTLVHFACLLSDLVVVGDQVVMLCKFVL